MKETIFLVIIFSAILLTTIILSGCTTTKVAEVVTGCKKVTECHDETYTSQATGCDGMGNCRCLHKSWAGLGACDSCECTKQVCQEVEKCT